MAACIVAQSTELLHLRDTDGDGKADFSAASLLSGFGTEDTHHNRPQPSAGAPTAACISNQSRLHPYPHRDTQRRSCASSRWRRLPLRPARPTTSRFMLPRLGQRLGPPVRSTTANPSSPTAPAVSKVSAGPIPGATYFRRSLPLPPRQLTEHQRPATTRNSPASRSSTAPHFPARLAGRLHHRRFPRPPRRALQSSLTKAPPTSPSEMPDLDALHRRCQFPPRSIAKLRALTARFTSPIGVTRSSSTAKSISATPAATKPTAASGASRPRAAKPLPRTRLHRNSPNTVSPRRTSSRPNSWHLEQRPGQARPHRARRRQASRADLAAWTARQPRATAARFEALWMHRGPQRLPSPALLDRATSPRPKTPTRPRRRHPRAARRRLPRRHSPSSSPTKIRPRAPRRRPRPRVSSAPLRAAALALTVLDRARWTRSSISRAVAHT